MRGSITKRGNSYGYVVEFGKHPTTGKRRQKTKGGFPTKSEAERALAQVLHELNTHTYVEPTKDDVREFLLYWHEQKRLTIRDNTFRTYRWIMNYHIIPALGHYKLANLKAEHVLSFYNHLATEKSLSNQTITSVHRVLRDAMNMAVRWGKIQKSPMEHVKPPRVAKTEMQVWNEDEVKIFLESTKKSRYHIIYVLAATTGMRRGEILGLKWKDIDWQNNRLQVKRSYTQAMTGYALQEPKSTSSIRSISLPQMTMDALRKQQQVQEADKQRSAEKGTPYEDWGLVVQTRNGFPINPSFLESMWRDLLRKSELPKIRFHDLRHTHASLLLLAGVHPKVVSQRLGHSSINITIDRYSHVYPSLEFEVAQQIQGILADTVL